MKHVIRFRLGVVSGLLRREDFILENDRSNEEFAKTHEVLMDALERFVAQDAFDDLVRSLLAS